MNILICGPKNDYPLAKICVASIRHYYPTIPIYYLKDELSGTFDTSEIERYLDVKILEYPIKQFGLSAAKIFFYTDERFKGQPFFVLDCDIVMIGRLLDQPWLKDSPTWDVIVTPERGTDPHSTYFTKTYFDIKRAENTNPDYYYPGYTFNCGQLFYKGGLLKKSDLNPFFDFDKFPFWKDRDIFPLVDQSVFNFLFPILNKRDGMKLLTHDYMVWSENKEDQKKISLEDVIQGKKHPILIHWAGALRTPLISRMTRPDILNYFESYYYSKIPLGKTKRLLRRCFYEGNNLAVKLYLSLKKLWNQ